MAYYAGPYYSMGDVRIGPPAFGPLRAGAAGEFSRWFDEASERDDIRYFSVYAGEELVGQVFLHDVDEGTGEALIGYHVFDPDKRGRGVGTIALTLLGRFVAERTGLRRIFIITSRGNLASRRLAEKRGFTHVGAPREDPEDGMVFERVVDR